MICRRIPANMYDVAALCGWLEDLAAEGLFLERFYPLIAQFRKAPPGRVRYRFEPVDAFERDDVIDKMEFFREAGWEFVCRHPRVFLIFRQDETAEGEMHTDPVVQSLGYAALMRDTRRLKVINAVLLFMNLGNAAARFFSREGGFFQGLIRPEARSTLILLFLGIWIFAMTAVCEFHLVRTVKSLRSGKPLLPEKGWERKRSRRRIADAASIVVLVLLLAGSAGEVPFSEGSETPPILSLQEIEGEEFQYYNYDMSDNKIYTGSTFWAPVQYRWQQAGSADEAAGWAKADEDRCRLVTEYDVLRFEWLAKGLYWELKNAASRQQSGGRIVELDIPGMDESVWVNGENQWLIGRAGKIVVCSHYTGERDLAEAAGRMAELIGSSAGH